MKKCKITIKEANVLERLLKPSNHKINKEEKRILQKFMECVQYHNGEWYQ